MKYVVIDTNTFLHYQLFTEIDWNLLFKNEVTIIVVSTVLHELDEKKHNEQNIQIRNRARKVISTLNEIFDGKKEFKNKNTRINFNTKEPTIDWKNESLDSMQPDDRIIASCIELSTEKDITLVTADLGLKLKAKNKSISIFELDDSLKLKEKSSKEQTELLQLKEKLKKLESSFPDLTLKILIDNEFSDFMKFEIAKHSEYPADKYDKIITDEVNEFTTLAENKIKSNNSNYLISNLSSISQNEIDSFQEKVKSYKNNLDAYYKGIWEYEEILSRIIEINFIVSNDGGSPGQDIDIKVHFPDGFLLIKEDEFPLKPIQPERPELPKTLAESVFSRSLNPNYINFPTNIFPDRINMNIVPEIRNIRGPTIKKTNSYDVEYHINTLKHKSKCSLESLYIYFEKDEDVRSFSIDYSLLVANFPDRFEGKLNIILELK